jgi:hypothetical protein
MKAKMNTKKILVSLCTIAVALFLVATVSAAGIYDTNITNGTALTASVSELVDYTIIEVDGINILDNPSVIAGETIVVKVEFTAVEDASDVRVRAEIEGEKDSFDAVSEPFDVEAGFTYKKTLTVKVPFELKDELSDFVTLSVKIWNSDYKSEYEDLLLKVQRPSYNPVVKSISTSQSVDAGETFPVEIVLKNMGYDELEDLYVTVSISELGVKKTTYFGDLVPLENCSEDCEDEDTVSGRLYLEVPYTAKAGLYTLEVEVTNDDVTDSFVKQIVVENDLSGNVVVTSAEKTVSVGEEAEYTLLLVNPTDSLLVYKVIVESSDDLSSSVDGSVVAVPAGSSKTVTVSAKAKSEGEYNFDVNVFSNDKLVEKVNLNLKAEGKAVNPIVVLTVVLAIIFLVLLVVLIVLIGRKPQKTEEFGESYY